MLKCHIHWEQNMTFLIGATLQGHKARTQPINIQIPLSNKLSMKLDNQIITAS